MKRLRELLDAKSEEVSNLAEERERSENGLFAARKELRRARRRLAQETHDLMRVILFRSQTRRPKPGA